MKLTIKMNETPKAVVEVDLYTTYDSPVEAMANFYTIQKVRKEGLFKIKAELHRFADQLTVDDLYIE